MKVASLECFKALTAERRAALPPKQEHFHMNKSSNDNSANFRNISAADAHGYAALALTESLIHSLVDNSTISLAEANNVVSIAIDATQAVVNDSPAIPASLQQSIFLLTDIRHSLGYNE